MIRQQKMGAPLPFGVAALQPDMLVAEAGDYVADNGLRIVLSEGNVVFLGAFDGTSVVLAVRIEDLLAAIAKYTTDNAQA